MQMLNDRARKIYRIMFHIYGLKEPFQPNVADLARLSTREPNQVNEALTYLIENNLLLHDKASNLYTLLPEPIEVKKSIRSTQYFMD